MLEKLKSLLLCCLILLSLFLTYQLWFGLPPLEKGYEARYEYVYFTPPPQPPEIIYPCEILFTGEDDINYLFRRGEKGYSELWEKGRQIIGERLKEDNPKLISLETKDEAMQTATPKLIYEFPLSVPLEFFAPAAAKLQLNIDKIVFVEKNEATDLFLEGEENFYLPSAVSVPLEYLLPSEKKPYRLLPPSFLWEPPPNLMVTSGDEDFWREMEIIAAADIYIPLEELRGAEFALEKEGLQQEELVRAFFLDLSMARRIEERDGAIFFTNGEKGLRIYPSGMLEYSAPQWERKAPSISYAAALQKATESQSLYGGWPAECFLDTAAKDEEGYRFIWRIVKEGLQLVGENIGSEMIINEQGVTFYRRFFFTFGQRLSEVAPFRPFEEALAQALFLNQQRFKDKKATLLSIRPVYFYQPLDNMEKAVPAWFIDFAETEPLYLHWRTLEPLKREIPRNN